MHQRVISTFLLLLLVSIWTTSTRGADSDSRSAGTLRMAEWLECLARSTDPYVAYTIGAEERQRHYRRRIAGAETPPERLQLRLELAYDLLLAGSTEDAIAEFQGVREGLRLPGMRATSESVYRLRAAIVMAYLRLGEDRNCLARHGPESCLMPIRGSGVHTDPGGSRRAVEELEQMLKRRPDDLAARWLINLAYMTLGEYPQKVPADWLVAPETFASEYDIGRFPNVASKLGLDVLGHAGGSIVEDLDGDGDLDVMASGWGMREQLRLFRNEGNGEFTDRTAAAGLIGEVGGLNLNHADYDNDGHPDVLVLRGAWLGNEGRNPNSLLRNKGGATFDDVTLEAGIDRLYPTQTAAWGDYDNDGWLDLFVGNESSDGTTHPCELYHNNGDGTFTDVAADVGVQSVGFVKGVAWGDYDNDGLQDLYLSRLTEPNVLYRNEGPRDGKWSFSDATGRAGVAEPRSSFPTWFWDFDNDGWLDILVAPFPGFTGDNLAAIVAGYLGRPTDAERPRLYRNDRDGTFTDVAHAMGLDDPMLVMGANFGDLDNDGWLDVYFATGEPHLHTLLPNRMYRNDRGRRFQNVTTSGGFGHLQKGHGVAFGDLDNDGDQDIYAVMGGAYAGDVAHNPLFLNPGHSNHWITLRLEGTTSNRSAIGARIRVQVKTRGGKREIHATVGTGGSFGSSSLQQEIGLGDATSIVAIEVDWPTSGRHDRFERPALDRAYRIREGTSELIPVELKPIVFVR